MIYQIKKIFVFFITCLSGISFSQDLSLSVNADLVSRYIWRGIDVNDAFNIQPALSLSVSGFSFGFWGSYSLTNNLDYNIYGQELDTWLGYTYSFESGISIGAIVTDYYYPNAGIPWGDWNNYDNPDGPGAHTVETGLLVKGPDALPLSLSGYINVYNDAGNNAYFQADYPAAISDVALNFFVGASTGSEENPIYGTETFNIINIGVKASKSIKITEDYSLPVYTSFIINPREEISYIVFGLTL